MKGIYEILERIVYYALGIIGTIIGLAAIMYALILLGIFVISL